MICKLMLASLCSCLTMVFYYYTYKDTAVYQERLASSFFGPFLPSEIFIKDSDPNGAVSDGHEQ